jgi:uncharacterized protein YkwD
MRTKVIITALIAFYILVAGVAFAYGQGYNNKQQPQSEVITEKIVNLVNQERVDAGLKPLAKDNYLVATATLKAQDMLDNDYYDHTFNGKELYREILRIRPDCKTAGENLARTNQTLETVVDEWMKSETHKKNLLGDYDITGVSIAQDITEDGKMLVITQHFCDLR